MLPKMARLHRYINYCSFIWGGQYKKCVTAYLFYFFVWEVISKTRASGSIRGSTHLEKIKVLGLQPRTFICFWVFGTPDETLAPVFDILHLALGKIDNGHKKREQKKGEKLKEKRYFKTEGILASRKTHLKRGNGMETCLMQSKLTTVLQASQPSMLS